MMKPQSHNTGFTLIELIVVIVILGTLAVVAAPRFLNLEDNARSTAVKSLYAAANTALSLTYSKATIAGQESYERSTSIETNLGTLELKRGYPEAYAEYNLGFKDLLLIDGEWDICYGSNLSRCSNSNSSNIRIGIGISERPDKECYIHYIEPTGTNNPSNDSEIETYFLTIETSEC